MGSTIIARPFVIGLGAPFCTPEVVVTVNPSRTKGDNRGALKTLHRTSDGFGWGTKPGETID